MDRRRNAAHGGIRARDAILPAVLHNKIITHRESKPMVLTEEAINPNFRAAYNYVLTNYAYLFHESLMAVMLLAKEHHQTIHPTAGGLHARIGGVRGFSTITVADSPHSIKTFVEILVHELKHLEQWTSGRAATMSEAEVEAEAYPVGINACQLYEYQDLQAALADMRRAK